ncbi:MAG: DUF3570 domain-containing protein, partial [Myxococcales bacterium]|nr:DUF3570 domain-containing protein [Myxococcales bacterium]
TYTIEGVRTGHENRSTSSANLGLTQLLSSTTVAHVDYGGTLQLGQLGNSWNSVPLAAGGRGPELLPTLRHRHALSARIAQWLPWNGAAHLRYRFYIDDWGILAHTVEAELYQRLAPRAYLRASYRLHAQEGAGFFTTAAPPAMALRTADSDLDSFVAHTVGIKLAIAIPIGRAGLRDAQVDLSYERYLRSNSLHASIASCSLGLRF